MNDQTGPAGRTPSEDQPQVPSVAADEKSAAREARTRQQRQLFIQVMLMFLVSIVVFVIGIYFFIIPHLLSHDLDLRLLRRQVGEVREVLSELVTEETPGEPPGEKGAAAPREEGGKTGEGAKVPPKPAASDSKVP